MRNGSWKPWMIGLLVLVAGIAGGWSACPEDEDAAGESEREVTGDEVPAAARAALQGLAGKAEITEFAEEVEHGHTFYEGSWTSAAGVRTDALVTPEGTVVEIEEGIDAAKAPVAVLAAARQAGAPDEGLRVERKTTFLYEIKFTAGERRHEKLFTPDGRTYEENGAKSTAEDEDDEDDDEADDDDGEDD
ncbi:MAG: hypothetical protein AB1726_00860 [Planctomycetota bacterium]